MNKIFPTEHLLTLRYMSWCADVVSVLAERHADVFAAALAELQRDTKIPQPRLDEPRQLLYWLRGDEPRGEFDNKTRPHAYVNFLLEEWRLFGPRGE